MLRFLIVVVAVAGCGGGSKAATMSIPAPPSPTVDQSSSAQDITLYPPPANVKTEDLRGLTRGCDSRIASLTPAQVRGFSESIALPQLRLPLSRPLTTPRNVDARPTRAFPFYGAKSPLTVLPGRRTRITLMLSAAKAKVGLVYRTAEVATLGRGRFRFTNSMRRVTFPVCSYDGRPKAAQWNGAIVFDKPTCARLSLMGADGNAIASTRVRLGVPRC